MAISMILEFDRFKKILKDRFGIEPKEVGIHDTKDFCRFSYEAGSAPDRSAEDLVAWLEKRYGLKTLEEEST